jgi:hypothetical protein
MRSIQMSSKIIDKLDSKNKEASSLRVNRPQYYTIRQYVAKMDQFLCALELDYVLFPAKAPKEVRRDFDASITDAKKSVNNLKEQLFKLSKYTKPSHSSLTGIRDRERKKDNILFPNTLVKIAQNVSEIETIDITREETPEIIDITVQNKEAELSLTNEAALSLLALKGDQDILKIQSISLPSKVRKQILQPRLLEQGYYGTGDIIHNLRTSPNKLHITKNINLLKKQISSLNPVSNSVIVNNPYLPTPSKPIVANIPDLSSTNPTIEIDGVTYAVSVVDFEAIPSKPT